MASHILEFSCYASMCLPGCVKACVNGFTCVCDLQLKISFVGDMDQVLMWMQSMSQISLQTQMVMMHRWTRQSKSEVISLYECSVIHYVGLAVGMCILCVIG